jgi:hypothetical protein
VTNVRCFAGGDALVTSGGNDSSLMMYDVVLNEEECDSYDKFR